MASPVVKLTFTDGRTEEVRLNPRVLVEVERKFGDVPAMEGTLYGAWVRMGRPDTFDGWLDTLEDIDVDKGDEAVPTPPEASDGS